MARSIAQKLSQEALYAIVELISNGLQDGLFGSYMIVSQEIWEEFVEHDMIQRAPGNDGDNPWDGQVAMSLSFGPRFVGYLLSKMCDYLLEEDTRKTEPRSSVENWEHLRKNAKKS